MPIGTNTALCILKETSANDDPMSAPVGVNFFGTDKNYTTDHIDSIHYTNHAAFDSVVHTEDDT